MIDNKVILLFGGTGSLGNEFVNRYITNNRIVVYSRDECKHWNMKIEVNNNNISFIIGDIINKDKIDESILRVKPNIIIIASAMKHIDQCEYNIDQSLNTNLLGVKNILDSVEKNKEKLANSLESVLFVSSDKACNPVNVYGMCKALSESLIVEKSLYIKDFKFVNIRYGNVLNSRGSIIPLLHKLGKNPENKYFTLTSENMTRFVMTLEQSIDLIEYTILYGETGDTVIPELISMRIKDLIEIFSEIYNKPIKIIGLKPGEKLLESLVNETQSLRVVKNNNYTHIRSVFNSNINNGESNINDYNSKINPLNKDELRKYLVDLRLI
jgi:UDP-N-acetylglucosamine 4,6-dehydratase/5-epimerase